MFLVLDRDENYIGKLKEVVEAKHTEELNGENILEIATFDTQEIKKGYRIVYKDIYGYWHEFIIKGIEEIREDKGIEKQLFCESSIYETLGDFIEDKRPEGPASHALSVALEPTRWEVGQVDDLGTNKTNFYRCSAKEAIVKVAETWKGEIRTRVIVSGNRITRRYVDLLHRRGNDLGKRFTYTKDLESITKTIHRDDVITALYGYGKGEEIEDEEGNATGGFGRRIDFSEINDGKAYVENNDAKAIWGRNNPNGSKSHVFGKVEFDDCEDKEELLQLTLDKLEEVSKPLVTYEAKVIDLKAFGFEHEGVELGDIVTVIDKEFTPELRIKARVVKIARDLLEPENNDITLGNFMPNIADTLNEQQEYINNFRSKQSVWDRSNIINADGTINANYLNDVVDELNKQINADGGYVYITEDGEGLITYDKPMDQSPTMAIQIKGGSFRIANSKLPNGEWNWRTFGTGDGFVATEIIAGILKGGKVKFDLTNGTLLIGDSPEDYFLHWDGANLNIRGNVDITTNPVINEINNVIDIHDNTISSHGTEIQKYKDGKLSGLTYNFDGRAFSIGGASGDRVEHTNQLSKYTHSDGSYTQISSSGLQRFISGTGEKYHYLVHITTFIQGESGSVRWIQLPSKFKGKKFTIYLALADSMLPPESDQGRYAIHRMVATPHPNHSIDYTNARVPIIAYKTTMRVDEPGTKAINYVQGMLIAIY